MANVTPQDLQKKYKNLHPALKEALFSETTADQMFEIGKRYNLLIDKIGEVASETGLLMLGVTHPDEFVGNLAERLKIDRQAASKIADDINKEIFAPVREHLRGLFGGSSATTEQLAPPALKHSPEVRPPEMRLDSRLRGDGNVGGNDKVAPQTETSLHDLEIELEKALAEERGTAPLSIIKQKLSQDTKREARDIYKGMDPYREEVGEDLPNIHGKAYNAPSVQVKKEILEEKLPETGKLISKQVPPITYQETKKPAVPQQTPTPKPVEETSLFSPMPPKPPEMRLDSRLRGDDKIGGNNRVGGSNRVSGNDKGHDPYRESIQDKHFPSAVQKSGLKAFRGFNMASMKPGAPEQPTPAKTVVEKPIEPPKPLITPAQPQENKDPYREKVE